MDALHPIGAISQWTVRRFHDACLTPVYPSTWERGEKRPSGVSLKLLTMVRKKGLASIA